MNLDGLAEAALAMARGSDPEEGAAKADSLPQEDGSSEVKNDKNVVRRYSTRRRTLEANAGNRHSGGSSRRDRGNLGTSSAQTDDNTKMDPSINPRLYELDALFNTEDMAASAALQSFTSNSARPATTSRSGTPVGTGENSEITSSSRFEAHVPMPALGDEKDGQGTAAASSAASSSSGRSSNHGDHPSTAQSTPDIGTSSSAKPASSISTRSKFNDPHMAVMSAGSAMARSNAAATASTSRVVQESPPLPIATTLFHASTSALQDEDDAASDVGSNHSSSLAMTSSAMQVPAKKQKGRRPNSATGETKNHKCPFQGCAWAFTRREHLKRHEKTHTQERPFTCDVPLCGLMFSRLDNLNSHKRTHEKGKRTAQWHVAKVVGGVESISPTDSSFPSMNEDDVAVPNLPPMPAVHMGAGMAPLASPTSTASVSSIAGGKGRKRKRPPTQQKRLSYEEMSAGEEEDMDGAYSG